MALRVLVVQGNPSARAFLARVAANSFSDAIEVAEADGLTSARLVLQPHATRSASPPAAQGRIDLLLLDLELPDGSGLDLLSEMAADPAHEGCTRVVTTLYPDDEHIFPALQRGADGYLLKEDRIEVLVETLQKIARGQPPVSPALARRLLRHFKGAPARPAAFAETAAASVWQDTQPSSAANGDFEALSQREFEVLGYLSKGFTIKEIASLSGISWMAVQRVIRSVYAKLKQTGTAPGAGGLHD